MGSASEELLGAWLDLTVNVRGNRLLRDMSLNEMMLLRTLINEGGEGVSVTRIGERLRLLKSQTHNVTAGLEAKGYVERRKGSRDGRTVYIAVTASGAQAYEREHIHVMEIVDQVVDALGEEDSKRLTALIDKALSAAGAAERRTYG